MSTETRPRLGGGLPDTLLTNNKVIFVESVVALMVAWWLVAVAFNLTDTISSPVLVAAEMINIVTGDEWIVHVVATTRRVLYGFVLTTIVGTVLGIVMGMSDFWEHAFQDYITVGLALPSLFAAVFAAMWFGISDITPMVAGAIIAFPFLTQNVYEGVHDIDNRLLEMSSAFGVSRNRVIRRVIAQSVLPEWFAGARYSFAICWKITTLAELIAASNGIGYMIEFQFQKQLSITGVLAWTFLFTLLMLFFEYGILQQIEERMFDWRQDTEMGMMSGAA